jgi:hypothetical protein
MGLNERAEKDGSRGWRKIKLPINLMALSKEYAMKKTSAFILSSINLTLVLSFSVCAVLPEKEKITKAENIGEDSYFPVATGNYWVWQDSFFVEDAYKTALDMTNGEAAIEIRKDSIVSVIKTANGFQSIIKRAIRFTEGRTRPIKYDTALIDQNGVLKVHDDLILKINLSIGDTVIQNGELFLAKKTNCSIENSIDVLCADTAFKDEGLRFVKGIGKVGSRSKRNASNLIEYRIGNGPVIKKHWLLEAPKE